MGQIKVEKNAGGIEGLCVIEPSVHGDQRGYFMETYNQKDMEEAGLTMKFVQDNQSCSTKGVLRGLHFQINYPQDKLVRVVNGEVFDVIHSSYTRGKVCWTKLGNGFTHVLRHKLIRGVPASSGNTGGDSSGNQGGNEIVNILYTATVATAGGALNLRSAAAVRRGNVIAQIPFGETVSVVQENGEWSKVIYGNATGYVSAQYLKKADSGNSGASSGGASVPGDGGYGVFIRCNSLAEAQAMAAALAACSVFGSND